MTGSNNNQDNCDIHMPGGWHLRKEITIGQILTMGMIVVSGLWWATTVETRMGQLTSEDRRIEEKFDIQLKAVSAQFLQAQTNIANTLTEIKYSLQRVNDKLDNKQDKK